MGAGDWKLVSLGGMISHVNFSYLLRSAESEQISKDIEWWVKVCSLWVEH